MVYQEFSFKLCILPFFCISLTIIIHSLDTQEERCKRKHITDIKFYSVRKCVYNTSIFIYFCKLRIQCLQKATQTAFMCFYTVFQPEHDSRESKNVTSINTKILIVLMIPVYMFILYLHCVVKCLNENCYSYYAVVLWYVAINQQLTQTTAKHNYIYCLAIDFY